MKKINIKRVDASRKSNINISNDSFLLRGKFVPSFNDGIWDYKIIKHEEKEIKEMTFPDEHYQWEEMKEEYVFLGAYIGDECVGLIVLQRQLLKYMYVHDLKVKKAYRGQGIATALMDEAMNIAAKEGYIGLFTIAQDNNLSACLFYINNGFRIGGLDTEVYKGTSQEGKSDVLFYKDFVPSI